MNGIRCSRWQWRWLLTILLAAGYAPLGQAQDEGNFFNTPMDVRLGERYFQRQCSRCHGADAHGNDETGAPNLTGRLNHASTDFGIFQVIREGVSGTAMLPVPLDLPDPQVWQLVAYINSLRTDPANIQLPGNVANGRTLYNGKGACGSCHMIYGSGGRQGPDLSLVGDRLSPEQLHTALVDPGAEVAPRWWTLRVTQLNGSVVEGLRMDEDSFSLRLIDRDANLWSFKKDEIKSYDRLEGSTMPSYQSSLSPAEQDDLVAYLFSLRADD